MIKDIVKKYILKYINFNFKLLVNRIIKDKAIMPHKVIDDIYEEFENINENKLYDKKIIVPYEDVSLVNKINIYKPYEILEVKTILKHSSYELNIDNTQDMILPLLIQDLNNKEKGNDKIILSYGNKNIKLELKYKNRFHYLPIKSDIPIDKIIMQSDKRDISIGKPFYKDKELLKNKPKLIVHIFIDALTQCMIDKFGYEIMPNTKKFFSDGGTLFTNTYAQAEWTLSSMAGVLTGKYTNEHLLYHPRREDKIKDITIADVLSKEGYTTFACTNIPKLTAINGYDKGFDRYLLALDKDYNYIINEAIEQLDAFGGNQYQFLSFFDIHEAHTLQAISSQASAYLEDFQFKSLKGNSKDTSILYDEERINMYKNSITHFDKKIQRLYTEIEAYDKGAVVVLHSDHGVNFMTQTAELLGKEREKVIFLYKNNRENQIDDSIKEIRELPSIMCNDLNIEHTFKYDNKGYAITESLYPSKEYEIAIRDNTNVLFFKVPWKYVSVGKRDAYDFTISYHLVDNEIEILNEDINCEKMTLIAHNHYLTLLENLKNYKEI